MSKRNERILQELRVWDTIYMSQLVDIVNAPKASIRRSIQELRREGYLIDLYNGQVRLW